MDVPTWLPKPLLLLTLLALIPSCTEEVENDSLGGSICEGTIQIKGSGPSQTDYHKDKAALCYRIEGDLIIREQSYVEDLDFLKHLREVEGSVIIEDNKGLRNTQGLQNLELVTGNITIQYNSDLESIELGAIEIHGSLIIALNNTLQGITGTTVAVSKVCEVSSNEKLTKIKFQESIMTGSISIINNDALEHIESFEKTKRLTGDLLFEHNLSLKKKPSMNDLEFIGGTLSASYNSSMEAFSELNALTTVEGTIQIRENALLSDISGFESLNNVGNSIDIYRNGSLKKINMFTRLESIDIGLTLEDNGALIDLTDFKNLTHINNITIKNNPQLEALPQFPLLTSLHGSLIIQDNYELNSIKGFESIVSTDASVKIQGNKGLDNLMGLEGLQVIGANLILDNTLSSLNGLHNLLEIKNFLLIAENNLTSLSPLSKLHTAPYVSLALPEALISTEVPAFIEKLKVEAFDVIELSTTENEKICEGDYFENIAEAEGCTTITGSLEINSTDITDFQFLSSLEEVKGNFVIYENPKLNSFEGLEKLRKIGGILYIESNPHLVDIDAFKNLSEVGVSIGIYNNQNLKDISGFTLLYSVGDGFYKAAPPLSFDQSSTWWSLWDRGITIQGSNSLFNISGFKVLNYTPALNLHSITTEDFSGMRNLESVGDLYISGSAKRVLLPPNLTTVDGKLSIAGTDLLDLSDFDKITSVGRNILIYVNKSLKSLKGFSNLTHVGTHIEILGNDALDDVEQGFDSLIYCGVVHALSWGNKLTEEQVESLHWRLANNVDPDACLQTL